MKILIVGLGSIAAKHIAAIRRLEAANEHKSDIYALRSSRKAKSVDGVTDIYTTSDAHALRPDFIIISNPTSHHARTIEEFAGSRIPLMIEKPVFDQPVHDNIIKETERHNTLTYVACNLRFLESLRFVSQSLRNGNIPGKINEVNIYCGSSLPSWRPGTDYRESYSAQPELGGGVHLDLIHELDYACSIFGMPTKTYGIARSNSSLDIQAIDYANYIYVYPEFCANIMLNYYRPTYKRTLEIVFENDIWTVDLANNNVTRSNGDTVFSSPNRIIDTYTRQMAYFMDLVESKAHQSANTISQANEILKIASRYERLE